MAKPIISYYDDDDENDQPVALPTKWAICTTCSGNGGHSRRFGTITSDEFYGPDWDEDSREAYMRGDYDAQCEDCDGTGKVKVADRSRMTKEQQAKLDAEIRYEQEYQAEVAAERRYFYGPDAY